MQGKLRWGRMAAVATVGLLAWTAPAFATVTSSVSGNSLSVQSNAGDAITVTCVGGHVKVNDADPGTGPALCGAIMQVSVSGGPDANAIDLSGFGTAFAPFGNASIYGNDGADTITGSAFGDWIDGGPGHDNVQGGSGSDTLAFSGTFTDDTIIATGSQIANNGAAEIDTYAGIEGLSIYGSLGNDKLTGGPSDDWLDGGPGVDQIDGGAGGDSLYFSGTPGNDTLDAADPAGLGVAPNKEPHTNVERFIFWGADGDDELTGASGNDQLSGGPGADTLNGGPGQDSLNGEVGNDILTGGGGPDYMTGGLGDDEVSGEEDADTVRGDEGTDILDGGAGNDRVEGGLGTDQLFGGDGNDRIGVWFSGPEPGPDILVGGAGTDTLDGGDGDDSVNGGDGDDTINVQNGNDDVEGGTGSDWVNATFGSLGNDVQVVDAGPAENEDTLSVTDCTGVNVTANTVSRPPELITYSGFEEKPCGFDPTPPSPTELRWELSVDIDYVDPALSYYVPSWQIQYATCAKLLNYPDEPSPEGGRLIPEIADGMPTVSADGRTYTFRIREGFVFAPSGGEVTADTFKWTFDRLLNRQMSSPAQPFFEEIVGARAVIDGSATSVSGVVADGDDLKITLEKPGPDFLARMAMPFTCPVPRSVPIAPDGIDAPVPSAGPYFVDRWTRNRMIVVRENPNYPGDRPHNWESVRVRIGNPLETIKQRIESGAADFGDIPLESHADLGAQYGTGSPAAAAGRQRYFAFTAPTVLYLAMNHERPLFGDDEDDDTDLDPEGNVKLKQAVNFAIDRTAMVGFRGAFAGRPTDQYLPSTMPGFRDESIYPATPNLQEARRLAGCSNLDDKTSCPPRAGILYCSNRAPAPATCAHVEAQLLEIGLDLEVKLFPRATQFELTGRRGEAFDMTLEGWHADFFDPFDFLFLLDGRTIRAANNTNFAYFNSDEFYQPFDEANALFGSARETAFGNLDVKVARDFAPWAPYAEPNDRYFFSERIGCQMYVPPYGINLAALCLRDTADDTVAANGEVTTDDDGEPGATELDALETSVRTPNPGTVVIREEESGTPASGYEILGQEVFVSAPDADAADPLVIRFTLDGSIIRPDEDLQIFRNGAVIGDCTGAGATPDPCVASRVLVGDDMVVTVRTSQASRWNFGYALPAPPQPPASPPPPSPPPASPPPPSPPPPPVVPPPPPPSPPQPVRPPAQARCVVPNVRGKTLAQGRRLLTSRRCALGRVTRSYSARMGRGKIISQSRRPGARLRRGTRVNVVVSRGRRRR